jgi:hypothetical protein
VLKIRMAWNDVFQSLGKNCNLDYYTQPEKLSFIVEGEIKTFIINKN